MKREKKKASAKRSGQGTGMISSMITPNLLENGVVLGDAEKRRKNKIVPRNDFPFDLFPQKWLSIKK